MKRKIKILFLGCFLYSLTIYCEPKDDLLEAVRDGNLPRLKSLISKAKLSLDFTDTREMTPLMIAATDNNVEIVKLLTEAGADINKKNPENGKTALMYAASNGHSDVVKVLSAFKTILLNAKDKEGKTALMHSVINGRKEVAQLLIENNANVNARTNTDESALSYALKTGRVEIITLLKTSGARE